MSTRGGGASPCLVHQMRQRRAGSQGEEEEEEKQGRFVFCGSVRGKSPKQGSLVPGSRGQALPSMPRRLPRSLVSEVSSGVAPARSGASGPREEGPKQVPRKEARWRRRCWCGWSNARKAPRLLKSLHAPCWGRGCHPMRAPHLSPTSLVTRWSRRVVD